MTDHYATLGVARTATPDEIKRAFRKLASQHHPDKGGDTAKFQQVEEAYRTLSDPQKRQDYDNPTYKKFQFEEFGDSQGGFNFNFNSGDFGPGFNDIFSMFRQQTQNQQRGYPHGVTQRVSVLIRLEDVATGGKKTVIIPGRTGNSTIELDIPRDRNGDFEPQLVVKHQTKLDGFNDKVISLYAKCQARNKNPREC